MEVRAARRTPRGEGAEIAAERMATSAKPGPQNTSAMEASRSRSERSHTAVM